MYVIKDIESASYTKEAIFLFLQKGRVDRFAWYLIKGCDYGAWNFSSLIK